MAKEGEKVVKLSALVDSIVNYAPQKSGIRSQVFKFADSIVEKLKNANVTKPFRRAALASWIRQDSEIQTAFEKAGVHKSDRYGRISLYIGHWIAKCEKRGILNVSKDSNKSVWIQLK